MPNHLMIIDPIEGLHPTLDTSFSLGQTLQDLGEEVRYCTTRSLQIDFHPQSGVEVKFNNTFKLDANRTPLERLDISFNHRSPPHDFFIIHMRKDPPYDLHYLQVLQILSQMERWESSRPTRYFRFLNHPIALMGLNEKLSLFDYPDMIHPSVAGFDLGAASSFFGAMAIPEMIMKPTHLFGGKGVFKFAPGQFDRDHLEASRDLHFYQEFDESIHDGEVRAFYAFGEPIAWCKKVPIKGQFLANTNHLSTREAYVPSKNLLSRLNPVAIDLAKKGAPIVGFDLIGEKITEINLTSPRLLYPENDPNKDQYFKSYAEKIRSEIN